MARATIKDVAQFAKLSMSTVNRAIHEPEKLRDETLKIVLDAAESVGFYGAQGLKKSLKGEQPIIRVGILLLQRTRALYRELAAALEIAANADRDHHILLRIEFLDELTPQNVANGLQRLAEDADILGVVSTEHPVVAGAIESLAARNIKVFAIISQLTARCNVGYVGLDAWKVGRTAGWAFDNLCRTPGKIGVLVGNHRYRCQETNESGFRSYFREHSRGFEILEAKSTFETGSIAQEVTEDILSNNPDLVGLFVSGGGVSGAIAALRNSGRAKDVIAVGYDLTEITRPALLDGTLNLLISHPLQAVARELIGAMARSADGGPDYPPQSISLPFEIYTAENL